MKIKQEKEELKGQLTDAAALVDRYRKALELISGIHPFTHEDAIEMSDIAKQALKEA